MSETLNQAGSPEKTALHPEPRTRVSDLINRYLTMPTKVTLLLGAILIMATVLLMSTDVIGRYLFKHPIQGSDELTGFLFLCTAAFAFAYTQKRETAYSSGFIDWHLLVELKVKSRPA